jgi:hypothetical protein
LFYIVFVVAVVCVIFLVVGIVAFTVFPGLFVLVAALAFRVGFFVGVRRFLVAAALGGGGPDRRRPAG